MKTLTLQVPDNVDEKEAVLFLASKLYEKVELTMGQAATLAGETQRSFMEQLGTHGVAIMNISPSELEQDLQHAQHYHL